LCLTPRARFGDEAGLALSNSSTNPIRGRSADAEEPTSHSEDAESQRFSWHAMACIGVKRPAGMIRKIVKILTGRVVELPVF
jgi:hypothetical protein